MPEIETGPEGENHEGEQLKTDYAQMFEEAKAEKASLTISPAEQQHILREANWTEITDAWERENEKSLSVLEADPGNNTGVGNREFALSQLRATLYGARAHQINREQAMNEGNYSAMETAETLSTKALEEASMWERMANGDALTAEEENFVRGRALSIRKEASRQQVEVDAPLERSEKQPKTLEQEMSEVPDDSLERSKFASEQFGEYDSEKIELFKAYLIKEARGWAANVPENARYPDSLAGIVGNSLEGPIRFLGYIVSEKEGGREVDLRELLGTKFSEATKKYLGIDIRKEIPDFDIKFG